MNVEIISLNPFMVSFRLYNLLGEIDGHPSVSFDMSTGEFSLSHDKGFANMISMSEHPLKGQPLVLAPDSTIWEVVNKQVMDRIRRTGFHDEWATESYNKFYDGNIKYPSYYFTMWNRDEAGEIVSFGHIGLQEYAQLEAWAEKQKIEKQLEEAAVWAIREDAKRRANPKSVLDVAPEGFVVPWSEVMSRFPELKANSRNAVDLRTDFDKVFQKVRSRSQGA